MLDTLGSWLVETGLPGLLALGGVIFLAIALFGHVRTQWFRFQLEFAQRLLAFVIAGGLLLLAVWLFRGTMPVDSPVEEVTATYTLQATATVVAHGEPQWSNWGPEVRIPNLGRDGSDYDCTDRANRRDVCVEIPASSVPVFKRPGVPRVEVEGASQWGSWCDGQRTDAVARVVGGQVCKPYWNWRESESHHKKIRLLYRQVETTRETRELTLRNSEGITVEVLTPGQVYTAELEAIFVSFEHPNFELLVRRSDGVEISASIESNDPGRLFVAYDEASQKYQVRLAPDEPPP